MLTNLSHHDFSQDLEKARQCLPTFMERLQQVASKPETFPVLSGVNLYGCRDSFKLDHHFGFPSYYLVALHENHVNAIALYGSLNLGRGGVELKWVTACESCGHPRHPCVHASQLARSVLELKPGDTEAFCGLFGSDDWHPADWDIRMSPEALELPSLDPLDHFKAIPRSLQSLTTWPSDHDIVAQLSTALVEAEDGDRRSVVEHLARAPDGSLHGLDFRAYRVPESQMPWAHKLDGFWPLENERRSFVYSDEDAWALVKFAKADRLYFSGRPVAFAGGLEALLKWQPAGPGKQRLVPVLPPPWTWIRGDHGPILSADGAQLVDIDLSLSQVDTLLSLPELDDGDVPIVREKWSQVPALGEHLLPLQPEDQVVLDRQLKLRGEIGQMATPERDTVGGHAVGQSSQIAIKVQLLDGKTAVSPDVGDGEMRRIEDGVWHRYRLNKAELELLGSTLCALGFIPRKSDTELLYVAPIGSELVDVDLVLATLLADLTWIRRPRKNRARLAPAAGDGQLQVQCDVREGKGSSYPYELQLAVELHGESVDLDTLSNSLRSYRTALRRSLQEHLTDHSYFTPSPELFEVSPGVFTFAHRDLLAPGWDQLNDVLDHAVRQGKKWHLTRGGLLRLATLTDLPIRTSEALERARGIVTELLDAQEIKDSFVIDGINDITFSPSQAAGVEWLLALRRHGIGGVLADVRGAGKTFQAIGAIAQARALREASGSGPALVMMELKEIDHWVSEHLQKHCSGLKWEVFHGTHKPSHDTLMAADVVVTTYGVFQRNVDRFKALRPSFAFADEAKRLKNRASKTWQAVRSLSQEGTSIVSINGTPLTKNVGDIWSGFELAVPGFLGSHGRFVETYRENADSDDYLPRLRAAMAPIFIRREIDNGRGMPAKTLISQLVTMGADQATNYMAALKRLLDNKEKLQHTLTMPQYRFELRRMVDRLRAITASPGRPGHLTSKGELLQEIVREFVDDGHQVLVFSHNNTHVDSISEILKHDGIPTSVYRGANAKERNREKGLFKDGHSKVLVLSGLGAKGLDLPEASRVVITDPWIDADEEDQKADRARRFVSTKDLEVFHLICSGTIEEGAMEILKRNREREQVILEGAPAPAPGFGRNATGDDYEWLLTFRPQPS